MRGSDTATSFVSVVRALVTATEVPYSTGDAESERNSVEGYRRHIRCVSAADAPDSEQSIVGAGDKRTADRHLHPATIVLVLCVP
jgi:hypothetical protein